MDNVIEIRYDMDNGIETLDLESAELLVCLAQKWQARAKGLHPVTQRARRRESLLQRSWRAMAELRAGRFEPEPFLLVPARRLPKVIINAHA